MIRAKPLVRVLDLGEPNRGHWIIGVMVRVGGPRTPTIRRPQRAAIGTGRDPERPSRRVVTRVVGGIEPGDWGLGRQLDVPLGAASTDGIDVPETGDDGARRCDQHDVRAGPLVYPP